MDPKLEKWLRWLSVLHDEVQQLVLSKQIFWDVQEIIAQNERIQKPSRFYRYLGDTYVSHALMGIRRQVKVHRDSISFMRLLKEIEESPEILSRKYYQSLYEGSVIEHLAGSHFDGFSDESGRHVCPEMAREDLLELKSTAQICEGFADRRVAHRDKRPPSSLPKFSDVDRCIEYLDSLYVKYHRLFHAQDMNTLYPEPQYDWKAIFYEPWIPGQS